MYERERESCVYERERAKRAIVSFCERMCLFVCLFAHACVCERERKRESTFCLCVRERETDFCLCELRVCKRESEKEKVGELVFRKDWKKSFSPIHIIFRHLSIYPSFDPSFCLN